MTAPIPGPRAKPIIGNLLDIQDEVPIRALERLSDVYGPIYKVNLAREDHIFVGGFDLFDELCDETRFFKIPFGGLTAGVPDGARGLFVATSEKDEDWASAHRILMPAFGPLAIEGMFDEMADIADQMAMKWARKGPEHKILLTDDFTRLTLDTIALCAMDYRFNSFYTESVDPFVTAMNSTLQARSESNQLKGMIKGLFPSYHARIVKDYERMDEISMNLVRHRRENPTEKKDLLNALIHGKDPKTGKTMRDDLITANMRTFLIAGHETTSGLLSFAFSNMLMHPHTYFAAQQEVDRVVGKDKIQVKHLKELKYVNAVLRETLRLNPTAPAFGRGVRPESTEEHPTIGGGKYAIPKGKPIMCLLGKIQRDPKIFGEDANEFKPERMLDERFEKLPKNAWKPFGTGLRGCIGRAFAWQEALLVTAMVLQNFDLSLVDPSYRMNVVQSLTIKPVDCYARARLRSGLTPASLQERLSGSSRTASEVATSQLHPNQAPKSGGAPLTILYGSNTGTCQALAQKLVAAVAPAGYSATVQDMDTAVDRLPTDRPVVFITASYEGQPPDNAARMFAWLESLESKDAFENVKFAVFGCGHRDWAATYQRVPRMVDELVAAHGATRLTERGFSDVSQQDTFGDFDTWVASKLLPALPVSSSGQTSETALPAVELQVSTQQRATQLQQNVEWATVTEAKVLTAPGESEKRHIEFELPENMTYQAGDYLSVLPLNPDTSVRRVVSHFKLPWDGVVTVSQGGSTTLPVNTPISVFELLQGYVEFAQPATRKDIELLVSHTSAEPERSALKSLSDDAYFTTEILARRTSVLDLLERFSSCSLPFPVFLSLLPPLRPRHYSISSSPLANPKRCTLTYSVIDATSWSAPSLAAEGRFHGVAGTYLRSLRPDDRAQVAVRSTNPYFRLPADPTATPVVMFCAGSGLAPFRGFVQERAVLAREGGRRLAPALLFVGCRAAEADRLYGEQMDAWAAEGAVDVRYAFSRDEANPLARGCRRVGERFELDSEEVFELFDKGAKFYVCGSGAFAKELGATARRLILEKRKARGEETSQEEVEQFMARMRNDRFVSDVFS